MHKKELGNLGENIACCFLKRKGYKILERNYLKKWAKKQKGEIDIIAKKDKVISFIEVKTLTFSPTHNLNFLPIDKINFKKQKKLIKTAQSWLLENRIPLDSKWQIDVISIIISPINKKAKISHFKNVVSY